jgi:hyperosmotically inducible protein
MSLQRFASLTTLCAALAGGVFITGCASDRDSASAGQMIDDGVITSKVKAKFVEDPAVSALNINVETFKGTVQLSGFANSQQEISRAVSLASDVKGVQSVKNDIRLKANQ